MYKKIIGDFLIAYVIPIFFLLIKNRKIVFFIGFRTLRIFLYQKPNLATFEGEGVEWVYILLTRNNPVFRVNRHPVYYK